MMTRKYNKFPYHDREGRNKFVGEELAEYLGKTVLNVGGGGKRHLAAFLQTSVDYFEMDIAGSPDIKVNLEKDLPLDIDDASYDTVVCTDVLEHLDNMHCTLLELIRITRKYIIISLPNPASGTFNYIFNKVEKDNSIELRKSFGKHMKFYGLPFETPEDRHKWFFGYTEAEDFMKYQAEKNNLKIREMFALGYYSSTLVGNIIKPVVGALLGDDVRKNLFAEAFWCVLER